ncbi:MAG: antibiotic biosynthesis monooxygenase [Terriglobales bacterium]
MIIVLFRSRLTPAARKGYSEMAEQMSKLAKASPGFVAEKSFTAEDGERLTVVWWQDEDILKRWRNNTQHLVAQRVGRDKWYEYYKLEVATVIRSGDLERGQTP